MKKILIFGAVPVVINKAKELGYQTYVIDQNSKLPGVSIADYFEQIELLEYEKCLEYAKKVKPDGIISASDFWVKEAGYTVDGMNLPGIKFETAKLAKDKYSIHKVLKEKKVDALPQYYKIKSAKELEEIKDEINLPVIVKPNDGLGSVGVAKVDNYNDLAEKCKEAICNSTTKTALVETFIEGTDYTAESFVYNGKIYILGILEKIMPKPKYYVPIGSIIPAELDSNVKKSIERTIVNTVKALGITIGPVNMDIVLDKYNNGYIVDIGARLGGNAISSHIIPSYTGMDYIGNIIKVAMGEEPNMNMKSEGSVVTRILNLTPGVISKLPNFSKYYDNDVIDIVFELKEGDTIPEYKNGAYRYGFLIVKGKNQKQALEKAEGLIQIINKDIIRK